MFQSCQEFIGKGISSWIIAHLIPILYRFCKNCSKFNQSLGFINTSSVNNWVIGWMAPQYCRQY